MLLVPTHLAQEHLGPGIALEFHKRMAGVLVGSFLEKGPEDVTPT